jgi:TetR/AcrR family transcriptional regulator, transcriptional repressor for nem operon
MKNTREHILKVSLKLFLQKSFKEVTMKEIVEKTGVSKGAFYYYFDSKERIFLEIINYAFSSLIFIDYSKFNNSSLSAFYHDYILYMEKIYASFKNSILNSIEENNTFDLNYYSLIFDAIRLFPDFREKMLKSNQDEMGAWKKVIRLSKEKGEINCSMGEEQIASVFFNINSGISMNNIILAKSEDSMNDVLIAWDSFYQVIKG